MDTGDELAEIFSISEDLVKSPSHKSAGTLSIDFNGLLETPLLLDEDLKEGCGGQLWPAGVVLSKYMLRKHKTSMKGKSMYVKVLLYNINKQSVILMWRFTALN